MTQDTGRDAQEDDAAKDNTHAGPDEAEDEVVLRLQPAVAGGVEPVRIDDGCDGDDDSRSDICQAAEPLHARPEAVHGLNDDHVDLKPLEQHPSNGDQQETD